MSIQKRFEEKDSAVSPVVGVMLMLVVTIIIAAIVAAAATGMFTSTDTPSNAVISLEDYTMGSYNQSDSWSGYTVGYVNYGSSDYGGENCNFAPYKMVFKHKGGEPLSIADLKLIITYDSATYSTPFSSVTDTTEFRVGDTVELEVTNERGTADSSLTYGLSHQSMLTSGKNSFVWEIQDTSNKAVSKGTVNFTKVDNTVAVTGISLSKSETSITAGNTETLTVTFTPANASNQAVTWSSSSESVATVANGVVTAVAKGNATITATSVADSTKTATCSVTVSGTS